MGRLTLAFAALVIGCIMVPQWASAQASKKLQEKGGAAASGQQKSWEQVDQINRETDQTKARYQQAQKAGGIKRGFNEGYSVKKSSAAKRSPKAKAPPQKQKPQPKKKK
jgi:hypothetical protein